MNDYADRLDRIEEAIADLRVNLSRDVVGGRADRDEVKAIQDHIRSAQAHLSLVRCAIAPPHVLVVAAWGPRRAGCSDA